MLPDGICHSMGAKTGSSVGGKPEDRASELGHRRFASADQRSYFRTMLRKRVPLRRLQVPLPARNRALHYLADAFGLFTVEKKGAPRHGDLGWLGYCGRCLLGR